MIISNTQFDVFDSWFTIYYNFLFSFIMNTPVEYALSIILVWFISITIIMLLPYKYSESNGWTRYRTSKVKLVWTWLIIFIVVPLLLYPLLMAIVTLLIALFGFMSIYFTVSGINNLISKLV